jgi:transposase
MSRPLRAKPFVTQMRRGRLPARSCGHDPTIVDRPDRPSGRNASPSGITPSTIMSPARSRHGSRTEIRLGARAHPTRTSNRAHAPPSPSSSIRRSRTDSTCDQVPAQIRSVAAPPASRVRRRSNSIEVEVDEAMIVLGADTHKRSHTITAVSAATGELMGEQTVRVGAKGFAALVVWARGLGSERVWAIEDCRHVSGSFERFLIERGERVVRVTTKLMADSRRCARGRGKSDSIDAIAVARAALREGLDALPAAQLEGPELDLRLLVDHRERLIRQRVALNNTLQWHLHDLWPELQLPGSSLFYGRWAPRVARRLARAEQTMRVRIARDELRRIRELSQTIKALEVEIAGLVARIAPQLLTEPGFGPLTAAKLVGEVAGAGRFASDAKLARAAGVAPIPVSSGKTNRHRLDRGGNRQINATIHRIAVTRLRCHPETQDYIARKRAEGKSTKEAIRCLKRHLARRIWHLLQPPHPDRGTPPSPSIS